MLTSHFRKQNFNFKCMNFRWTLDELQLLDAKLQLQEAELQLQVYELQINFIWTSTFRCKTATSGSWTSTSSIWTSDCCCCLLLFLYLVSPFDWHGPYLVKARMLGIPTIIVKVLVYYLLWKKISGRKRYFSKVEMTAVVGESHYKNMKIR